MIILQHKYVQYSEGPLIHWPESSNVSKESLTFGTLFFERTEVFLHIFFPNRTECRSKRTKRRLTKCRKSFRLQRPNWRTLFRRVLKFLLQLESLKRRSTSTIDRSAPNPQSLMQLRLRKPRNRVPELNRCWRRRPRGSWKLPDSAIPECYRSCIVKAIPFFPLTRPAKLHCTMEQGINRRVLLIVKTNLKLNFFL